MDAAPSGLMPRSVTQSSQFTQTNDRLYDDKTFSGRALGRGPSIEERQERDELPPERRFA